MKGRIKKYLVTAMCLVAFVLPMLQPMTVKAAETGQTISVSGEHEDVRNGSTSIETYNFSCDVNEGCEVVGYLGNASSGDGNVGKSVILRVIDENGDLVDWSFGASHYINYCSNGSLYHKYVIDGNVIYERGIQEFVEKAEAFPSMYYEKLCETMTYSRFTWSGFKIFESEKALREYVASGSTDGMIDQPIDLDKDGILDKSIGYLQNLKRNFLNTGETDENGVGEISWSFSWDDTYPDYDDSYKVEVKADCTVGVKSMFGLGSEKTVKSDIRSVSECQYNELQVVVSLNDLKNIFNDFLSDNLPSGSDITSFGKTSSYKFTYYFRIYRYDETTGTYRYGKWVRMLSDGNVLDGNTSMTGTLGDFDENGDWIIDTDSTYGDGVETVTGSGKGDTIEDAIKDAEENRQDQLDFQASDLGDMTNWFISNIKNMINALGSFPSFIGSLFSFLPPQVLVFIGVALIAVVICRFLGR